MAVELGEVSDFGGKAAARQHFGLPSEKSYLFCFSFDLNSSIHRKNPQACVDAFLAAFPAQGEDGGEPADVGLVIKVHPPRQPHAAWDALKALAAQDRRIHIIEVTLSRPDLLALYACCDCFVSLHRAEGFGRGIAEALLLGRQVVVTGYSGNLDFCREPQAKLVAHLLQPVLASEYAWANEQVWAACVTDHAAQCMELAQARPELPHHDSGLQRYSVAEVGETYRTVFTTIFQNRFGNIMQ